MGVALFPTLCCGCHHRSTMLHVSSLFLRTLFCLMSALGPWSTVFIFPLRLAYKCITCCLTQEVQGPTSAIPGRLPEIIHGRVVPSPLSIVWARLNHDTWELLVRWVGFSLADATWEQLEDFRQSYPYSNSWTSCFVERVVMLWTYLWARRTSAASAMGP